MKTTASMIRVEIIRNPDGLENLQNTWNNLLQKNKVSNFFLTFEWCHIWWDVFGDNHQMYTLKAMSENEVVGIAPLMRTVTKNKTVIEFIGTPDSDYSDFIISRDEENVVLAFLAFLVKNKPDWSTLCFSQIPENSPTYQVIADWSKDRKNRCFFSRTDICPAYQYEGSETDRSGFSVKKSRRLKRKLKSLEKNGGFETSVISEKNDLEKILRQFFTSHINRWQGTSTPSKFLEAKYSDFYTRLFERLQLQQQIFLVLSIHQSKPISFFMGFIYEKTAYLYTSSYDLLFSKYSPGEIIHDYVVEYFIKNGYEEVNMGRGDEPYKKKYSNRIRYNYRATIYKKTLPYYWAFFYNNIKNTTTVRRLLNRKKFARIKLWLHNFANWA